MMEHKIFLILAVIAYCVFFALALYAVKKKNTLPMLVALVVSQFFNLMVSLTAH